MVDKKDNHGSRREKILIIDDSPIIREMLGEILTDEGFIVDAAENGETGAARALKEDYMLIICDVHMPRMNGLETVREIITAKPLSKIVLTDSFPDKLAKQARAEGALCCLQKPFDVNDLRRLIKKVIAEGVTSIGR
jgi:CheY-like chemotaxis protein